MKSRTIAIAGSIAALAFTAGPISAIAAAKAPHRPAGAAQQDRSRDTRGVPHTDKSVDSSKDRADNSADLRDL